MRVAVTIVCLLGSQIAGTSAFAQYTSAQREACMPDVFRLCSQHIPDASAITACLKREKPRLSAACRGVFAVGERGGRGRNLANAGGE